MSAPFFEFDEVNRQMLELAAKQLDSFALTGEPIQEIDPSINLEAIRAAGPLLPNLAQTLDAGRAGDTARFRQDMFSRNMLLEQAQIPPLPVSFMHEFLTDNNHPYLFLIKAGEPMMTFDEKQAELQERKGEIGKALKTNRPAQSLRTVSLGYPDVTVLVSAVSSDGRFADNEVRKRIANDFWQPDSSSQVKRLPVNPFTLRPAARLGAKPGTISPFFHPTHAHAVDAMYYVEKPHTPDTPVEIGISPYDMLFMRFEHFNPMLQEYQQRFLPQGHVRKIRQQ